MAHTPYGRKLKSKEKKTHQQNNLRRNVFFCFFSLISKKINKLHNAEIFIAKKWQN